MSAEFKMCSVSKIVFLIILIIITTDSRAQQNEVGKGNKDSELTSEQISQIFSDLAKVIQSNANKIDQMRADINNKVKIEDPEAESLRNAYYALQEFHYEHRKNVFEWQLWASSVVLGMVVLIVLMGIIFAGSQLYVGLKKGSADPSTEVEFAANKIRVTSTVSGIVILVISVAFLFLFLHEVYTLQEL